MRTAIVIRAQTRPNYIDNRWNVNFDKFDECLIFYLVEIRQRSSASYQIITRGRLEEFSRDSNEHIRFSEIVTALFFR